jgi:thiol-disulfide isomerase/thioredoxin
MRRLWAGMLGLALLAPALRADDKPQADKAAAGNKTPKEQYDALLKAVEKDLGELQKEFTAAKTPAEKAKVRDKVMKDVFPGYAKKMLALAKAHPKHPSAEDALIFVCSVPGESPLVPEALALLLRDYADSAKLPGALQVVAGRTDGEALLRTARAKAPNKVVKLVAGYFLANALSEKDEPTAAQTEEAEKLLAEFIDQAKGVEGIAPAMIEMAKGTLTTIRKFSVGKTAPEAKSTDLEGKAVKLSDYKGKVVVLDFWATWCQPCRGMIPHERAMVKKHAGKPFVFISVSADEKKETLKEFIDKEPMPWVHWWSGADGGLAKEWNIQGFPTFYIIDAKGVIRGKVVGGGDESEKKIDALVDKLVKEAGTASE